MLCMRIQAIPGLFRAMPVYCADIAELFHLSKEMLCFGSVKLIFCLLGLNKGFGGRLGLNLSYAAEN